MARYRTFWQDFFHAAMHYKAETKFCVSAYKSDCAHAHGQTKRLTVSKFRIDTGEGFCEDLEAISLKIDVDFF